MSSIFRLLDIIDLQARAKLKAEASRLYLSYLWWVLEPMLYVLVFYIVFETLLNRGGPNFVFFLMCGKIPYLWLNKSIVNSGGALFENRGLIGRIDVPKIIFPYITLQEMLYKQWVGFLVLFATALYFDSSITLNWLWLIPVIVVNYLVLVVPSLIAALLVTWAQDFRILIQMGMLFLMFVSGIFWDINDIQNEFWRDFLLTANPLAFLIDSYRKILMYNQAPDLIHLAWLALAFAIMIVIMHRIYELLRYRLTRLVLEA